MGDLDIRLENTDFMKRAISELEKGVDKSDLEDIGYTMGEALGTFAPEKTGALRQAYDIKIDKNKVDVTWDGPTAKSLGYVKYQYYGIAMSPVTPIFEKGEIMTNVWRTKKGVKKHLAEDMHPIGEHKRFVIEKGKNKGKLAVIEGYTPKSNGKKAQSHWIDAARETPTVYNPMRREVMERLKDAIGEKIIGKRYYT